MTKLFLLVLVFHSAWSLAQNNPREYRLTSPDEKIIVTFTEKSFSENGAIIIKPVYSVTLNGKEALLPSVLGLVRGDQSFEDNLKLVSVSDIRKINEHYVLKSGKNGKINHAFNEQVFTFLAGINGKPEARVITFALPFAIKVIELDCITDGPDLNSFGTNTIPRDAKGNFTIHMSGNGGFVAGINL